MNRRLWIGVSALAVVAVTVIAAVCIDRPADSAPAPRQIVRVEGSGVLGDRLVPALAEAFLDDQHATGVRTEVVAPGETVVSGISPGDTLPIRFEIVSSNAARGRAAVAGGKAGIAMVVRPAAGPSPGPPNEAPGDYLVALDGVVPVVNYSSHVRALSIQQLHDIFTCRVIDWDQVDGDSGRIVAFAPDDLGGDLDVVSSRVLADADLCPATDRVGSAADLSAAVAAEPQAVGLASSADVVGTAMVPVLDDSGTARGAEAIHTGQYPLTRRLELQPAADVTALERKFVMFASTDPGRAAVTAAGFDVPAAGDVPPGQACQRPADYCAFIAGTDLLPYDVSFALGHSELDDEARGEISRLAQYLMNRGLGGHTVRVAGFADATGESGENLALSDERAAAVATELAKAGVPVVHQGFGQAQPRDTNDTEIGRQRNRRAEFWLLR